MGEVAGAGKLGQKCTKSEDYSKWKEKESKRVGVKVCKTGRLLQAGRIGKQAGWGRSVQNRKIAPRGRKRKASGLEQKCAKPEDYSKREEEESKRVGAKVCKTGRLLQEEGIGKQAGWSRSVQNRKIAPRGRKRKASGLEQKWVKPEDCSKYKKEERKTWLKQGKSICIIGLLDGNRDR